ncbi:MAG: RNA ligase family protein, partial [Candidatus Paceibacterota bacterium]
MTGECIVAQLKNLQPIEGADRILQAIIYGETVIISKDHEEGELGLLFDMETELSLEYCYQNNLFRHSELNKDKTKEGYIGDNCRVRPIRLKGVQCSGFWMPLSSLDYIEEDFSLKEGDQFSHISGNHICKKYKIPAPTQGFGNKKSKEGRVSMKDLVPTFKEHFSTDHWERNKHRVSNHDFVIITEKLHGTSFRCGNLPTITKRGKILNWILKLFKVKPQKEYKFVVGSRRTVKSIDNNKRKEATHYYDSDLWTDICSKHFDGKLEKGETIYGEIVGYTPQGKPIMGTHSNEKLKSFLSKKEYKAFIEKYGEQTIFNYSCYPNEGIMDIGTGFKYGPCSLPVYVKQNKVFVYRITITNEDGETIDLSWEQVKQRCEKFGVNHVPELYSGMYYSGNLFSSLYIGRPLDEIVKILTNKPSENFPEHINEGVCIR